MAAVQGRCAQWWTDRSRSWGEGRHAPIVCAESMRLRLRLLRIGGGDKDETEESGFAMEDEAEPELLVQRQC